MSLQHLSETAAYTEMPAFVVRRPEGLYVNPAKLPSVEAFFQYADRVFQSGARFSDLNYREFCQLLHMLDSRPDPVRLAADVVAFPESRKALYKGVKIADDGSYAVYVFEPLPPFAEGSPAPLAFDEFVAAMWLRGVRFGIEEAAVREMLESGRTGRLEIAHQWLPTAGRDAELQEASEALRRDDSPRILASGKADLRRFKNRFPQVAAGAPLLRKTPRVLGSPGRTVTGEVIAPAVPEDVDLAVLSGPGTHIERRNGLEHIVASLEGFISLDLATNQVAVTEKIENRTGVSVRTTGDLALAVDEFVEHGEVQEGRIVQGRHMTFRSDVYGSIVSEGGNIRIDSNLSGGGAESRGGDITVLGRVSSAQVVAWEGTVTAGFAESSLIIGRTVRLERAVNCEIVAESLDIGIAEGCGIAARAVHIASAAARKNTETVVSLLVPDLSVFERQLAALREDEARSATALEAQQVAIDAARADPEFAKYLALESRIRQGSVTLTEEQQGHWRKMTARFAVPLRQLAVLNAERQRLQDALQAVRQAQQEVLQARVASGAGLCCRIDEVVGETVVRQQDCNAGIDEFRDLAASELRSRLHGTGSAQQRLFAGAQGAVAWQYQLPELVG